MSTKQLIAILFTVFFLMISLQQKCEAQSTSNCQTCHATEKSNWLISRHANTQADVASELAQNWAGQSPDSVINGTEAEDCVACHSPTAVTVNGGMAETQVMAHFFTTTNGVYTSSTVPADSANWPQIACVACHNVPANHPTIKPVLGVFNSKTVKYDSVQNASSLCGYCHGSLRFSSTDHRLYDAWKISRHGHRGQYDVAAELAANETNMTPDQVVQSENCIGCHAPTSVTINGGVTEGQALGLFFTTTGGVFTSATTVADTSEWPDVACNACHNPHNPDTLSYFSSGSRMYQIMSSSEQLCGQCHGNLRFPDTDHLSYNIEQGTGGIGVPQQVTMPGARCVDCHMQKSDVDGTNAKMFGGHSWQVFITESDGSVSAACTKCHANMNADSAETVVTLWKTQFATLDSIANVEVAKADTVVAAHGDSLKAAYLSEAQHNMIYAESDESGGFHNHNFSVALLNDAIAKAKLITTDVKSTITSLPSSFALMQNYPNPFNPSTEIEFQLPRSTFVTLTVYNILGARIRELIANRKMEAGNHAVVFDAENLPGGVYLYRLSTPEFTQTRKMILLR
ncbi:MAG: ammonia-forming cytochrome c nitrite reductase subunit c552 [Bacteroidota bacterium]